MRLQVSRSIALTSGQLLLNVFLASWLLLEYLHNPYMQLYLTRLWSANASLFTIGIGITIAGVLGSYLATSRGIISLEPPSSRSHPDPAPADALKPLDVCPVCNNDLKELSKNRFQCKSCHRYFKR